MTDDVKRHKNAGAPSDDGMSPPAATAPTAKPRRRRRRGRKAAKLKGQIDLGAILNEPLPVLKRGKRGAMHPLEAIVRKQVQKAISEKSMPAIIAVIDLAIEHDLVALPPQQQRGGTLAVPTSIGLETWTRIFRDKAYSIDAIIEIVRQHYEQE